MSDYPRMLLISESTIRLFEEKVGVRGINKTECAKALEEHDKQIRADAIDEVLKNIEIGIDATGHSDEYTTGFSNALIWLRSCITSEEPQFLKVEEQK